MSETPRGRDLMAVFHFYDGTNRQEKYEATKYVLPWYHRPLWGKDQFPFVFDAELPNLEQKFIHFSNGEIRQTKDIEKIVTSYC